MARMRAQSYIKVESTLFASMATGTQVFTHELAPGSFPRQIKNLRGDLQFTTADTTPTGADAAAGWVALVRWPASETFTSTDLSLADPRVLHPVMWNMRNFPGHIHYEFKGINLAQRDKLYVVVKKVTSSGSDSLYVDHALIWAQLNHVPTNA